MAGMDGILNADYGDKGQKAINDADRARAGERGALAAGVRGPLHTFPSPPSCFHWSLPGRDPIAGTLLVHSTFHSGLVRRVLPRVGTKHTRTSGIVVSSLLCARNGVKEHCLDPRASSRTVGGVHAPQSEKPVFLRVPICLAVRTNPLCSLCAHLSLNVAHHSPTSRRRRLRLAPLPQARPSAARPVVPALAPKAYRPPFWQSKAGPYIVTYELFVPVPRTPCGMTWTPSCEPSGA